VARTPANDTVAATESTTSLSYVDLATAGPTVTATCSTQALVILTASSWNTASNASWMAYEVSGASTFSADDTKSLQMNSSNGVRYSACYLQTGMTAGTSTFQAKYRVSTSGTGWWSQRRLAIIPL